MGARIEATDGHAAAHIHGTRLHAIAYQPDDAERAGEERGAARRAARRRHDHGHRAGRRRAITPSGRWRPSACTSRVDGLTVSVAGGQRLAGADSCRCRAISRRPRSGWSAAAALPGSRIEIEDVGLNPTRTALLDVLRRFGARVEVEVTATARRRAARHDRRRGRSDRHARHRAGRGARPDRRAAGDRRARRARRRGDGPRRRRAARQGKRSHRRAGRRLPRARHRRRGARRTDSSIAGRPPARRGPPADAPTRAAITAWRWRSRSRRSAPSGPSHHRRRRTSSAISYPGFFETLGTRSCALTEADVKADKIYLVGFMAAGKTTVARALAQRLGWRGGGHRRGDRSSASA